MSGNVPAIRFAGFTEPWEQRKLGDFATRVSEMSNQPELPRVEYEDINPGQGTLNKELASKGSVKGGIAFEPGDVLYGKLRPYLMNWLFPQFRGIAVGDFWVLRPTGCDGSFLFRFIQSDRFQYNANISSGSKMPRADWAFVSEGKYLVPKSREEQHQIGETFQRLDNLITLHQRKHDQLATLKKSLLEKMFPKLGSDVPELRFAGFTEPWEQRKLGDFGSVEMCKRIYKEQTSEHGEVPFFKIGTFGGVPDAFISRSLFEEYRALYPYPNPGALLISAAGSIGRIVKYAGEEAYYQDSNIVWLEHNELLDDEFLADVFDRHDWTALEGSTIKRLYNKDLLDFKLLVPTVSEQRQIGSFFSCLNNLITLHQRKHDQLATLKKSLLEKMFV